MELLLLTELAAAAAVTSYALVCGLIDMATSSWQLNSVRSQNLMQKRVAYQAPTIFLAFAAMVEGRSQR